MADRDNNFISFVNGKAAWNGQPIDDARLRDYIKRVMAIAPRPTLTLYGRGADCSQLRRIAELIEVDGDCKPAICAVSLAEPPAPRPGPPPPPMPPSYEERNPSPEPVGEENWVGFSDYPEAAMRVGESGDVVFTLDVDDRGKPTACAIIKSRASAALGEATCQLMMKRAHFRPARDRGGKPVASHWRSHIVWENLRRRLSLRASWVRLVRFTIGAEGELLSCSETAFGPAPSPQPGCAQTGATPQLVLKRLRGTAAGPVTIVMRLDHAVDGKPLPEAPALAGEFKPISAVRTRLEIGRDGVPNNCFVDKGKGEVMLGAAACRAMPLYAYAGASSTILVTHTVLTDGDPGVAQALAEMVRGSLRPWR